MEENTASRRGSAPVAPTNGTESGTSQTDVPDCKASSSPHEQNILEDTQPGNEVPALSQPFRSENVSPTGGSIADSKVVGDSTLQAMVSIDFAIKTLLNQ